MSLERPWRNEDGSLKSDTELKIICENWNAKMWERYLREYNYAETEVLQSSDYIDRTALESFVSFISSAPDENRFPNLRGVFNLSYKKLNFKEKEIIKLSFEQNLSDSEISKELNKKRDYVRVYKSRALSKIKQVIIENLNANEDIRMWFKQHKYPKQ
jgi:RNA polymerase sigma factor (sigma-70 family)